MLTVNMQTNGTQTTIEASKVIGRSDDPNSPVYTVVDIVLPDNEIITHRNGTFFVMNDCGSTVAKYYLTNNNPVAHEVQTSGGKEIW